MLLCRFFFWGLYTKKGRNYLCFGEAMAIVADVYCPHLKVATALVWEAGDEDRIRIRSVSGDGVFGGGSDGGGSSEWRGRGAR